MLRTEPVESKPTPHTPKKARRAQLPEKENAHVPLSPQRENTISKGMHKHSLLCIKLTVTVPQPPKTPRHRDAQKIPVTPRHRVSAVKPLTPRSGKLFGTPTTPTPTVLTAAKAVFSRSATSARIVGRDGERTQLATFLSQNLKAMTGGCLYVSGPPGCGKSALLAEMIADLPDGGHKKAWVNCMSLKDPKTIYPTLHSSFAPDSEEADLECLFMSGEQMYVLVLDEIDALLSSASAEVLHSIFELSLRPCSRLLLVGIANALDLTDRFLPRLKARNLEPELLPFLPYTASQIDAVVTARLRSLLDNPETEPEFIPFVHPTAIQLLSRKIAGASGDLRKAFDIVRRALELVEIESRRASALSENSINSPSRVPVSSWTPLTAPRATLTHVARASAAALGSSVSARIPKLSNHQKAVLCVLVAKSGTSPLEMRRLREEYIKAVKNDARLVALKAGELAEVVGGLEDAGVVDLLGGANGKGTPRKAGKTGEGKIVSRVGKMDLITAMASGEGGECLKRLFKD